MPIEEQLKVVRELEKNGLIDYEENLDSFFAWLQSPIFQVVPTKWDYKAQSFKPVRPLLPEELERLKKQSYHLNRLGKKAWQAVLNAVLEQLRMPTQGAIKDAKLPTWVERRFWMAITVPKQEFVLSTIPSEMGREYAFAVLESSRSA